MTRKGATASRLGREETSQEEEATAPLSAPGTDQVAPRRPSPAGATSPSPLSARTTTQHLTLQTAPKVQLRLRFLLPPDPSQLSFRKAAAQNAACSGQQVGSGASRAGPLLARPTPLLAGPGPGSPGSRFGRGSSLPYLRHFCRTDGSHLRGGRSWVTARTRM